MPVVVTLDKALAERGVTLTELSQRIGVTLPNLSVLRSGRARAIRFTTLEAICRALDCQPGDLLTYAPDRAPHDDRPGDGVPGAPSSADDTYVARPRDSTHEG